MNFLHFWRLLLGIQPLQVAPTGLTTRYDVPNPIREDLEDIIYDISPMDTYFMNHVDRMKANSTLHEWQTDQLAVPNTLNAAIEGDDLSAAAATDTNRYKNYTQIVRKQVIISGTTEAVRKAGMDSQVTYQMMKKGKELKRDIEVITLHNHGATAGIAASARLTAGVENFLFDTAHVSPTNQTESTTTAPASGVFNNTPVDGTATAFLEADAIVALGVAWANGGETDVIMMGQIPKRKLDQFTGIATRFRDVGSKQQAQIIGAADVYVSDFGSHKVVMSRYVRTQSVLFLDISTWGLAYLRPIQSIDIAKTGDSEKRLLLAEFTVVGKSPIGNAKITGVL